MCIRDNFETMQKQLQEHSTAELCILRCELNKQVTKISEVLESITLKIAEVEKSVSSDEESMSNKIAEVEKSVMSVENAMSTKTEVSITNIKEQIKNEVEECLKLQIKQLCEQTVPIIKTEKDAEISATLQIQGTHPN